HAGDVEGADDLAAGAQLDFVAQDAGVHHGLDDAHELPGMTQAELEAHRFSAGQLSQLRNELHHLERCGKGAVTGGRDAVFAHGNAAGIGDFLRD
nr:hypothetical protein [Tanacetum cinerariifolium]